MRNQRHRQYWDKPERMDKADTQALLRPVTEWTNQRHRQALRQDTENEQTRNTNIIETRHRMEKPETHEVLRPDRKWTNQRHMQH